MKVWGGIGMKIYTNELGHMTNVAAMPIYGKNLKNLLLQNQQTDGLETKYVALCMGVLPKLFKLWPWVDLDPFYAKVIFGHIGICMGKTENCLFFGNYFSLGSQSCLKHLAKRLMKLSEYQRSRSFFDLGQRSLRFQS